jgi:hypothetical protein
MQGKKAWMILYKEQVEDLQLETIIMVFTQERLGRERTLKPFVFERERERERERYEVVNNR